VGRLARGTANSVRKALSAAKIKALGDMKCLLKEHHFNSVFSEVLATPSKRHIRHSSNSATVFMQCLVKILQIVELIDES
jgi:hypothetical protein